MILSRRPLLPLLGLSVALGASAAGTTACDGKCAVPTEQIAVTLPPLLENTCAGFQELETVVLDGAVHHEGATLVLATTAGSQLPFPDLDITIPDGTFVRLTFWCSRVPPIQNGYLLVLENLPTFAGKPNPTEDGARLWGVVAFGGSLQLSNVFPFDYALEDMCEVVDTTGGHRAESLILDIGGGSVLVPPGQTRPLSVPRGAHTGDYSVQNVNITFASSDLPEAVNFRVRRAE